MTKTFKKVSMLILSLTLALSMVFAVTLTAGAEEATETTPWYEGKTYTFTTESNKTSGEGKMLETFGGNMPNGYYMKVAAMNDGENVKLYIETNVASGDLQLAFSNKNTEPATGTLRFLADHSAALYTGQTHNDLYWFRQEGGDNIAITGASSTSTNADGKSKTEIVIPVSALDFVEDLNAPNIFFAQINGNDAIGLFPKNKNIANYYGIDFKLNSDNYYAIEGLSYDLVKPAPAAPDWSKVEMTTITKGDNRLTWPDSSAPDGYEMKFAVANDGEYVYIYFEDNRTDGERQVAIQRDGGNRMFISDCNETTIKGNGSDVYFYNGSDGNKSKASNNSSITTTKDGKFVTVVTLAYEDLSFVANKNVLNILFCGINAGGNFGAFGKGYCNWDDNDGIYFNAGLKGFYTPVLGNYATGDYKYVAPSAWYEGKTASIEKGEGKFSWTGTNNAAPDGFVLNFAVANDGEFVYIYASTNCNGRMQIALWSEKNNDRFFITEEDHKSSAAIGSTNANVYFFKQSNGNLTKVDNATITVNTTDNSFMTEIKLPAAAVANLVNNTDKLNFLFCGNDMGGNFGTFSKGNMGGWNEPYGIYFNLGYDGYYMPVMENYGTGDYAYIAHATDEPEEPTPLAWYDYNQAVMGLDKLTYKGDKNSIDGLEMAVTLMKDETNLKMHVTVNKTAPTWGRVVIVLSSDKEEDVIYFSSRDNFEAKPDGSSGLYVSKGSRTSFTQKNNVGYEKVYIENDKLIVEFEVALSLIGEYVEDLDKLNIYIADRKILGGSEEPLVTTINSKNYDDAEKWGKGITFTLGQNGYYTANTDFGENYPAYATLTAPWYEGYTTTLTNDQFTGMSGDANYSAFTADVALKADEENFYYYIKSSRSVNNAQLHISYGENHKWFTFGNAENGINDKISLETLKSELNVEELDVSALNVMFAFIKDGKGWSTMKDFTVGHQDVVGNGMDVTLQKDGFYTITLMKNTTGIYLYDVALPTATEFQAGTAVSIGTTDKTRLVFDAKEINPVKTALTIDGLLDDAYLTVMPIKIAQKVEGDSPVTGFVYVLFDDEYIYAFVVVNDTDANRYFGNGAVWNSDSVEFYLDTYNKATRIDQGYGDGYRGGWQGEGQFRINAGDDHLGGGAHWMWDDGGLYKAAVSKIVPGVGYTAEFKIAWGSLKGHIDENTQIGFTVDINDGANDRRTGVVAIESEQNHAHEWAGCQSKLNLNLLPRSTVTVVYNGVDFDDATFTVMTGNDFALSALNSDAYVIKSLVMDEEDITQTEAITVNENVTITLNCVARLGVKVNYTGKYNGSETFYFEKGDTFELSRLYKYGYNITSITKDEEAVTENLTVDEEFELTVAYEFSFGTEKEFKARQLRDYQTITVDGAETDKAWADATAYAMDENGSYAKVMWDEENIYIFVSVVDSDTEGKFIAVQLDLLHSLSKIADNWNGWDWGSSYRGNNPNSPRDIMVEGGWKLGYGYESMSDWDHWGEWLSQANKGNLDATSVQTENGYTFEFRIGLNYNEVPEEYKPHAGQKIGLAIRKEGYTDIALEHLNDYGGGPLRLSNFELIEAVKEYTLTVNYTDDEIEAITVKFDEGTEVNFADFGLEGFTAIVYNENGEEITSLTINKDTTITIKYNKIPPENSCFGGLGAMPFGLAAVALIAGAFIFKKKEN